MRQLALFGPDSKYDVASPARSSFSHENVCQEDARLALEQKYEDILFVDNRFNRKIVSYQANKGEIVHGWIKYREGFSANLVEILMNEFQIQSGETVLDPFSGSSTVLLVAKTKGLNAVGIELLPVCHLGRTTLELGQRK
ncbi:MAG: site-specific DNA-methyltransferase [Chloroflexi bacterium]|nr:site-specific DNA-methyltransferase [Chloroflexota bacterium]